MATVAHLRHTGEETVVVVDRQESWSGTGANPVSLDEVEAWLAQTSRSYNKARVVCDPWQAVHLAQRLRAGKIRTDEFTFSASSVGRLALTLYRLLRDHQIELPDDPELCDELANLRLVETSPGSYRIDHDPDKHDDRAISLALAAQSLLSTSRPKVDRAQLGAALNATADDLWQPGVLAL